MKLSTNAKLVILVLVVGSAIYGLFKFYPSFKSSMSSNTDSTAVVKADSLIVVKVVDTVSITDITVDTTPVKKALPVVVVKPIVKKKEVKVVSKPKKKKVVKADDNDQSNDFVPSY